MKAGKVAQITIKVYISSNHENLYRIFYSLLAADFFSFIALLMQQVKMIFQYQVSRPLCTSSNQEIDFSCFSQSVAVSNETSVFTFLVLSPLRTELFISGLLGRKCYGPGSIYSKWRHRAACVPWLVGSYTNISKTAT